MFGCFPVAGIGYGSFIDFGPCCISRPVIPFGEPIVAPFGFSPFSSVAVAGNPFCMPVFQNPLIPDNFTVQSRLFQKLGLIG